MITSLQTQQPDGTVIPPAGDQVAMASKWNQHERLSDSTVATHIVTYLCICYITTSPAACGYKQ